MHAPWHRHKTNRSPLPALIISTFLMICSILPHRLGRCLSGTKQSSLTVKCLDIGDCLCRRWENGKSQWPAINISVSAVFVFMSLLLPNSHFSLTSPLTCPPQLRVFRVIVSSLFLYYPTLQYHDKNWSLLRGVRFRLFAIVIVFDWESTITWTKDFEKR